MDYELWYHFLPWCWNLFSSDWTYFIYERDIAMRVDTWFQQQLLEMQKYDCWIKEIRQFMLYKMLPMDVEGLSIREMLQL